MKNLIFLLVSLFALASCSNPSQKNLSPTSGNKTISKNDSSQKEEFSGPVANAGVILTRPQVPVLCYHHIFDGTPTNEYTVNAEKFKQQMKMLSDSGYHSILPDQYYNYLVYGAPLPPKPFMLSFDDTDEEQFVAARPEMNKYGFKGVFFIMTISIGRPRYMTKEQIKQLSDEGNVIASHTWRHDRVDRFKDSDLIDYRGKKTLVNDWDFQLINTKKQLEEITGKPVNYFAYPFGIWSKNALPEIEKRGYKLAFQLSEKRDPVYPLMTVRRMIVAPTWTAEVLIRVMKSTFK